MIEVIKKLRFTGHDTVLILNTPEECKTILPDLKASSIVHSAIDKKTTYPAALLFASKISDLKKSAPAIIKQLEEDAVFWIAYPKKTSKKYKSDINRDINWNESGVAGYETVSAIAIDDDWSALRFRQPEKIKTMNRRQSMAMTDQGKSKTSNKTDKVTLPASKTKSAK